MQSDLVSMVSAKRKSMLESIFGVFYVMTEGDFPPGGAWKFRFTVALLLIDGLQVLRSLTVSPFMWSKYSISVMRSVDLVSLLVHTVQRVIPEWVFFSIAIFIAIGAIANAGYVMKLFRAGHVKIIWPLKILRLLVASIVTIFFTTVLEFLIYPVRCVDVDNEDNFSAALHGEARPCQPWNVPAMAFSIVTIVVATAFIAFSLLTTFLDFTVNPLCRHPLAQCTGRLESLWTFFKVCALVLVYLSPFISATACTILLFLLSIGICYYHLTVLPFHHDAINMVRGGIYLAVVTFCLASIIVQHYPHDQRLQNWLLGALPVAFMIGVFAVSQIVAAVNRYLGVLRGQWDEQTKNHNEHLGRRGRRASIMSEATQGGGGGGMLGTERSMRDQFFDVKWEAQRRFTSGSVAYLASRMLLQRRSEDDMQFLMSLLTQCLKDHPNSHNLCMFHLLVLRYVFKERSQTVAQERLSKMQSSHGNALDRSYIMFAVGKKMVQEGASESLGKGSISAVNLMEFDQRMEAARKCHRECVIAIKSFWKLVAKRRRHHAATHDRGVGDLAQKMTQELEKFTSGMRQAQQEYAWLHEKYPSSAPLLSAYASFCDHVLNDNKKAEQLRQQVSLMETYGNIDEIGGDGPDDDDDDANDGGGAVGGGGGDNKSVSTDSEPYRVQMARYMQSWGHLIMSRDAEMLRELHWRVRGAIFFLVALSLAFFVVTDFVLFNDVALKTIRDIDDTGHFRELAATAPYMLRSEMMEARSTDLGEHLQTQQQLIDLTKTMQEDHYRIFEQITTSAIQDFYEDPNLEVNLPRPTGWVHTLQSFRHLGSDFARRVASAAMTSTAEHREPVFALSNVTQNKRDVAYVFENTVRYVMPCFDQAVAIYEHQMDEFGKLTTILTSVSASLTALLVTGIAVSVLRARAAVIKRVHSNRVSVSFACEIPRSVAVRFYKYYSDLELDMAMMEDDEQNLQMRMADGDGDSRGFNRRNSAASSGDNTRKDSSRGRADDKSTNVSRHRSSGEGTDCHVIVHHSQQLRSALHDALQVASDSTTDGTPPTSRLTADNLQILVERTSLPPKIDGSSVDSPALRIPRMQNLEGRGQESSQRSGSNDQADEDEEQGGDHDESERSGGYHFPILNIDAAEHFPKEEEADDDDDSSEESEQGESSAAASGSLGNSRQAAQDSSQGKRAGAGKTETRTTPVIAHSTPPEFEIEPAEADPTLPTTSIPAEGTVNKGEGAGCGAGAGHDEGRVSLEAADGKQKRIKTILRMDSESEVDELSPCEVVAGEATPLRGLKSLRFSASSKGFTTTGQRVGSGAAERQRTGEPKLPKREGKRDQKNSEEGVEGAAEQEEEHEQDGPPAGSGGAGGQGLTLQTMPPEMQEALAQLQYRGQPWFNRIHVYAVTLLTLLALCMLYSLYPARRVPTVVTMAPTMDKATARMSLSRACIFLARELVLDDGLSRMTKGEISGTLSAFIHKYEEADRAVRLGDKELGILVGADHRSKIHNDVMYKIGCPWRQREHRRGGGGGRTGGASVDDGVGDCSLPSNTYPTAAEDGLFNLQSAFLDSLNNVLNKFGEEPEAFVDAYNKHRETGEDVSRYEHVDEHDKAYDILRHDPDLLFLEQMFDGDLHEGLDYMVVLFEEETKHLLDYVHVETRLLFGVYLAFVSAPSLSSCFPAMQSEHDLAQSEPPPTLPHLLLVFYWSLFLRTLKTAHTEVAKAQKFAYTVPLHVLETDEAEAVKAFYMRDNGTEDLQEEHGDE